MRLGIDVISHGGKGQELARFDAGTLRRFVTVFRWLIALVAFLCGLGEFWPGVWIFAVVNLALMITVRGVIVAYPNGVYVRDLFTERWYPWNAIERFEPLGFVRIVGVNGETHDCWAVQRANISRALGRVSRVDRAVGILETLHDEHRASIEQGEMVWRGARMSTWEWIQALLFVPGAALLGVWVS